MNKKQRALKNQNEELTSRLNKLNIELQNKVNRASYLKNKYDEYVNKNPEQAEAYGIRLNKYKPKILNLLESINKIELILESMPRIWIS